MAIKKKPESTIFNKNLASAASIASFVFLLCLVLAFLAWRHIPVNQIQNILPEIMLAIGLILSVCLFFVLLFLNSYRIRGVELAERMTLELRQSEKFLRQSEKFLQSTLDALSAHIAVLDENGKIILVNESWKKFAKANGFQDESYGIGSSYLEVCKQARGEFEEEAQEVAKGIRLVMNYHNYEFQKEYPCHSPSEKRWFMERITRFERVGISRVVVAHEDITQRKLIEEALKASEEKNRLIIETAHDAFIEMNDQGLITNWNREAEKIFGWTRDEAIGRKLSETIIPERMREAHAKGFRHFLSTGEGPILNKRIEINACHRDGHEFPVELTVWPIRVGDSYRFNAFLHDITDRKRMEEELKRAHDAALEATRAKSDFLATMSHEIRTPMNAIIGMADLLEETALNAEQREYVRLFKKAGDTLLALINDILDLSKVESGSMELENVEFETREVVERTADLMAIRAHQKGLELACHIMPDVPEKLIGDPHRLRQILINLLGNAIKFTEKGEVLVGVKVKRKSLMEGKTRLIFSVRDTGIGIPKKKLETVFQSFVQADTSTTRKYGGSGLGLAICKRLVEIMGGNIYVESTEGKGSNFTFDIEFAISQKPLETVAPMPVDFKDMGVLIVDDNVTNRLILREIVSGWGAHVREAGSGEEALQTLKNAKQSHLPFQLLLLDCRMPGKDGFEVAEEIKRDPGLAHIVIMMLTSDSRYGDIARARSLGLSGYLVKPIKKDELAYAISTAMNRIHPIQEQPDLKTPGEAPSHPLNILFVEDSSDNQLLIRVYLKNMPYQLDIVENGKVAVEKFKAGNYDMVLMDIQMPVMDGYTAARLMREWEGENKLKSAPIIALTAHAFKEDTQKCIEAGFSAYITKPVKKLLLLEVLAEQAKSIGVRKEAA